MSYQQQMANIYFQWSNLVYIDYFEYLLKFFVNLVQMATKQKILCSVRDSNNHFQAEYVWLNQAMLFKLVALIHNVAWNFIFTKKIDRQMREN